MSLTIINTPIRELNGLYSLNDLHAASGGENRHKPSNWLANQQTTDFIKEFESTEIPVILKKQGLGTFVCKELVIHYAMWISPQFSLQVIQTFLNASGSLKTETQVEPDLSPPPKPHYALDDLFCSWDKSQRKAFPPADVADKNIHNQLARYQQLDEHLKAFDDIYDSELASILRLRFASNLMGMRPCEIPAVASDYQPLSTEEMAKLLDINVDFLVGLTQEFGLNNNLFALRFKPYPDAPYGQTHYYAMTFGAASLARQFALMRAQMAWEA